MSEPRDSGRTPAAEFKRLSKQLSWLLRHQAEHLGLVLDAEGYAALEDVLEILRRDNPLASLEAVYAVLAQVEADKQRFSIVGDSIRANYGHSLEMRIAQEEAVPPTELFHGTSLSRRADILRVGLRPMQRQYVHLTPDIELARRVGARHGKACLLRVDTALAHADGLAFYRANRNFWLADEIAARYLAPYPADA